MITLHNGTPIDSARMEKATFYEAGSSKHHGPKGGPTSKRVDDELVIKFKGEPAEVKRNPIIGEGARKDKATLESVGVRVDIEPADK